MRRFDPKEVVRLYQGGKSLPEIHELLGISIARAYNILREAGVRTRTPHEAKLLSRGGWQRIQKLGHANTRLITLSRSVLARAGLRPEEVSFGLDGDRIVASKSKAVKADRPFAPPSIYINPASTVVCTIPARIAWMLGFGPKDDLEGKWIPGGGRLKLELKPRKTGRLRPPRREPKSLREELRDLELDLKSMDKSGFPVKRQLLRVKRIKKRMAK